MRTIAVIPARMASTRFPGKPLASILGLPMIEHVRRRVGLAASIDEVIVATCDREIADVVTRAGGRAAMTSDKHERCTDRVAEAVAGGLADVVVNVQGDEPLIRPEMIDALCAPLKSHPSMPCTNLMAPIDDDGEFQSLNVIKTVADLAGNALYFSRQPVPSMARAGGLSSRRYKQLGIIAFRREFLELFARLEPTPLEQAESIDMLRALEHGYRVRMVLTEASVVGVDTPADLERAEQLLRSDPLVAAYGM